LPGAETNLELIQHITPQGIKIPGFRQTSQIGLRHIAFAADDIQSGVRRIKAKGIRFQSEVQRWKRTGKQVVYFFGPDGILLELAQHPNP
jgi:catechol 2,3-dioxygenase-like lactoylglutathione lyase family enzyme